MISSPTKTFGTTLLERIGNTPLVRLDRLTAHLPGIHIKSPASLALAKFFWTPPVAIPASRMPCSAQRRAFR
jgi:hypothetical protein